MHADPTGSAQRQQLTIVQDTVDHLARDGARGGLEVGEDALVVVGTGEGADDDLRGLSGHGGGEGVGGSGGRACVEWVGVGCRQEQTDVERALVVVSVSEWCGVGVGVVDDGRLGS